MRETLQDRGKSIVLNCSYCLEHVITLHVFDWNDEDGKDFYFNLFSHDTKHVHLIDRIRCAWRLIKDGTLCADDVTLKEKDIKKLVEFLNENITEDKSEE